MNHQPKIVGEASPHDAFQAIQGQSAARLIDVRTHAEWSFVGVPIVPGGPDTILIEWQTFPSMAINTAFGQAVEDACPDTDAPLYFLCRSGVRSHAAAQLMGDRGYARVFNVVDGFEGPPNGDGHRGTLAGWKADGLPWRQT